MTTPNHCHNQGGIYILKDEGVVIKAYGGFYYVEVGDKIWDCSLRGRFRAEKKNILIGDKVRIVPRDEQTAVVDEIFPRSTELVRPPIANVEQAVIVFALQDPTPNLSLLDRLLVIIESNNITPVICFNKIDLDDQQHIDNIDQMYRKAGYRVLFTSAIKAQGVEQLKEILQDQISVFTGPSGVGKSTLLNSIQPGLHLKTGQVSQKIGRGKHTTRHTELMKLDFGGLVADTPGFTSLFLPTMKKEELANYFPEFADYTAGCKFSRCQHDKEPGCKVKEAVAQNEIHPQRYQHFIEFLNELAQQERRY